MEIFIGGASSQADTPDASHLSDVSVAGTYLAEQCAEDDAEDALSCPALKYRHADGACNNVFHRQWGASFTAYGRLLPASYADGRRYFCHFLLFYFTSYLIVLPMSSPTGVGKLFLNNMASVLHSNAYDWEFY